MGRVDFPPGAREASVTARRFYAPAVFAAGRVVILSDTEAHHLTSVLRLRSGDMIRVFDGRGHEFTARVDVQARHVVTAQLLESVEPAAEPRVRLTLAQSVLKGRGLDMVIRDATMLGVAAIQPILSERSNAPPAALALEGVLERWRRIAVSSAKQSGRAVVPAVAEPIRFDQLLADTIGPLRIILVEPSPQFTQNGVRSLSDQPRPHAATLAIGPEGGWTQQELESADEHDFRHLTLGARTLRADAAPVAAISVLQFFWGDL